MTDVSPRPETYSRAQIEAILADLNAHVPAQPLQTWAQQAGIPLRRAVDIPALTYVRLAGKDEGGEPIVLMFIDDAWERAV